MAGLTTWARSGRAFALRDELLKGAEPNEGFGKHNVPPVSRAAQHGHAICVRILLDFGADPNQADSLGRRPLDFSCDLASTEVLLDGGATPDLCRTGQVTLCATSAYMDNEPLVRSLLRYGANPEERDEFGHTVRELLTDRTLRLRLPETCDPNLERRFIIEQSRNMTLGADEYVAQNPKLLFWGCDGGSTGEENLVRWAREVQSILGDPDRREEAYRKHLRGDELVVALRGVAAERRRRTKEEDVREEARRYAAEFYSG